MTMMNIMTIILQVIVMATLLQISRKAAPCGPLNFYRPSTPNPSVG